MRRARVGPPPPPPRLLTRRRAVTVGVLSLLVATPVGLECYDLIDRRSVRAGAQPEAASPGPRPEREEPAPEPSTPAGSAAPEAAVPALASSQSPRTTPRSPTSDRRPAPMVMPWVGTAPDWLPPEGATCSLWWAGVGSGGVSGTWYCKDGRTSDQIARAMEAAYEAEFFPDRPVPVVPFRDGALGLIRRIQESHASVSWTTRSDQVTRITLYARRLDAHLSYLERAGWRPASVRRPSLEPPPQAALPEDAHSGDR